MSYEPTTWSAGDTITSAKLNKLEQGIMNSGNWIIPVIEIENELEDDENIIQKDENIINEAAQNSEESNISYQLGDGTITYKMIEDALNAGQMVFFKIPFVEGASPASLNINFYSTIATEVINYNDEEIGYQIEDYYHITSFGADTKTEPLVYHWMPEVVPDSTPTEPGEDDPSSEHK